MRKQSRIIGFVGQKGSGKSLSMTAFIVRLLAEREKVISNMPVKISDSVIARHVYSPFTKQKIQAAETIPLDWDLFYKLDESLMEGWLAIDEITYYDNARNSMESRNRVFNIAMRQVRHRRMSILYTARDFKWIDRNLRDETDVLILCRDLTYSKWGFDKRIPGGVCIEQKFYDISGVVTGSSIYQTGFIPFMKRNLDGMEFWNCYDDSQLTSIEEAVTGVKLNLRKRVISNQDDDNEDDMRETIINGLHKFRDIKGERFNTDEFWEYMRDNHGIQGSNTTLGRMIPKNISRKQTRSGYFYDVSSL